MIAAVGDLLAEVGDHDILAIMGFNRAVERFTQSLHLRA
jgi:hypothetical protein